MKTHRDKIVENKYQVVADNLNKSKNNSGSSFQFVDNRPETVTQLKLHETIQNSPRIQQWINLPDLTHRTIQQKNIAEPSPMANSFHDQQEDTAAQLKGNTTSSSGNLPVIQRQLAPGPYRLKNKFFNTNLRENNAGKTVKANLPPRQNLMVIPNGGRVSNFKAGAFNTNEHSWVQTQNNGKGWIEDSMLEHAQFFTHAADQGSFIGNLNNRSNYLQELENHINIGSNFDPGTNTLNVSDARIQEAAVHLNQGFNAQTTHISNALNAAPNPNIYDASIANHVLKNALWNTMKAQIDAGVRTTVAAPMAPQVKLKAKAALAQIISTNTGHDVFNQVNQLSGTLGIPINYIEEDNQVDFNLYVTPVYGAHNALVSLTVTLPPDHLFNDSQSFKRINDLNADGSSNMGVLGRRISVSPVDTDLLHEFTHALHYLTFEDRRRNAVANAAQDNTSYDLGTGGHIVLGNQDNAAEARTIHRNQSFGNLGAIANGLIDPTIPATAEQYAAFAHLAPITATIPTENDYRAELGIGARQDHRAMRVNGHEKFEQLGSVPILSL